MNLREAYGALIRKTSGSKNPDDILIILNFVQVVAYQNKELMNFCRELGVLSVQIELNDANRKYWFSVHGDEIEFGRGEIQEPTATLTGSLQAIEAILLDKTEFEKQLSNLPEFDKLMNSCQDYWEIFTTVAKIYRRDLKKE